MLEKEKHGYVLTNEMAVALLMDQEDIANQKKEIEVMLEKLLHQYKFKNGQLRFEFLWIPRYSPEFNPCERAWAMLKQGLVPELAARLDCRRWNH